METLFKYLSSLDKSSGLKYFVIFSFILAIMPYYELISKYLKQFILRKNLKIIYFKHVISPDIYIGKDSKGRDLYASNDSSDILINNSVIHFVWKVEGALKIDLLPIDRNLKGNACSSIINSNIKKYTLIAYGFKGERVEAVIDFSDNILHHLYTHDLVGNRKMIRRSLSIDSTNFHKSEILISNLTKTKKKGMRRFYRNILASVHTKNIITDNFIKNSNLKRNVLYAQIENSKVTKAYNFSTKKYQSIE